MSSWRVNAVLKVLLLSVVVVGCHGHVIDEGVPAEGDLCMLTFWTNISPCDRMEIRADGVLLGSARAAIGVDRVFFRAGGRMHFTFRLLQGDAVRFEPEFDYDTSPGTMIAALFMPRDTLTTAGFGTAPSIWFPSKMEGSPTRVWCSFGAANARADMFSVSLREGADVEAFKSRLQREGYRIRHEPRSHESFWIEPRSGYTVVQCIVEVGQWDQVASTDPVEVSMH